MSMFEILMTVISTIGVVFLVRVHSRLAEISNVTRLNYADAWAGTDSLGQIKKMLDGLIDGLDQATHKRWDETQAICDKLESLVQNSEHLSDLLREEFSESYTTLIKLESSKRYCKCAHCGKQGSHFPFTTSNGREYLCNACLVETVNDDNREGPETI